MMRSFILITFNISLLLFTSCIGYEATLTSKRTEHFAGRRLAYPVSKWQKMPVYSHKQLPARDFEIIAEITGTAGELTSDEGLIKQLKKEAGYYGADAIFITEESTVEETSFDGFSALFDVIPTFSGDESCPDDNEVSNDFLATRFQAWGIRFTD